MIDGFRRISFLLLAASLSLHAQTGSAPASTQLSAAATSSGAAPSTVPNDPAGPMLKQAYDLIGKKDLDGALTLVDEAVKNNPQSFAALTLRGMIYSQKKEWTSAENDFKAALALDPNNLVVKFNLGEIRFVQKDYAGARARFEVLSKDPTMGDFASYKMFLCDLFGGHEDQAKAKLDTWNEETGPSFYWGNAAWSLVHKNTEDARSWINSAQNIFLPAKNQFYASSLINLGYLPLPDPTNPSH